jgi:AGZA family xanthine/uracil permease-like MFS transporter
MVGAASRIDWNDYRTSIPAFLTIIGMPFTYSIANGVSIGIVAFAAIHLASGRPRDVHWLLYILAALLVCKFAWVQ